MALRPIIAFDPDRCLGCGQCLPCCPFGAIEIHKGLARLRDETLCDGQGHCLGHCSAAAPYLTERDALPHNPRAPRRHDQEAMPVHF